MVDTSITQGMDVFRFKKGNKKRGCPVREQPLLKN
jgi:hypothetical protein